VRVAHARIYHTVIEAEPGTQVWSGTIARLAGAIDPQDPYIAGGLGDDFVEHPVATGARVHARPMLASRSPARELQKSPDIGPHRYQPAPCLRS
jgi:hypothetical protein